MSFSTDRRSADHQRTVIPRRPNSYIHSVINPVGKMTSGLHVYGGDFFNPPQPRSQWDHETLDEQPWDMENTRRVFREAEARFAATA